MTTPVKDTKPQTYREAMNELQEIVDRLRQTEDIDVDDLVKDVTRAKELIDFCGGKIQKAQVQIEKIVGELRESEEGEEEPEPKAPSVDTPAFDGRLSGDIPF